MENWKKQDTRKKIRKRKLYYQRKKPRIAENKEKRSWKEITEKMKNKKTKTKEI